MLMYNTVRNAMRSLVSRGGRAFAFRESQLDPDREFPFLTEQIKYYAGPQRMRHSVFHDNFTGETREMRAKYRQAAFAEPSVKAALLGKVISVCSLDLQVRPADKKNGRDHEVAEFCKHAIKQSEDGVFGVVWEILFGALMDGWSCSEKLWKTETRGKWAGKRVLKQLKAKDTRFLQPEIDPYRNITGIYAVRANSAHRFDPEDFVIFTYLKLFQNPTGISDLRAAYRAIEMMPAIMRLRAVFLEKYSGPWIKGKLSDLALRKQMQNELAQARGQGYIVLDKDSDVEVIDMAVRGTSDFQSALQDLREEIVTALAGAYLHMMTSPTSDPRGDSGEQRKTTEAFVWMLAELVAHVIQRSLIPDLVDMNYGAMTALPLVSLEAVRPSDILDDLKIDQALSQLKLPLSREDLYERARRPIPLNEDALTFDAPAPGAGGPGSALPDQFRGLDGFAESMRAEVKAAIDRHFRPIPVPSGRDPVTFGEWQDLSEEQVLDLWAEGEGFTGTRKDSLGRNYYWVRGKRVSRAVAGGAPAPTFAKRAHRDPNVRAESAMHLDTYIDRPDMLNGEIMVAMPSMLAHLTVPQLREAKRRMGLKGGKRKDEHIAAIRARLEHNLGRAIGAQPAEPAAAAPPSTPAASPDWAGPRRMDYVGDGRRAVEAMLPGLSDEEIAHVACAPPGARVRVSSHRPGRISFDVGHDGVNADRTLYMDNGKLVCSNNALTIEDDSPHKGKGFQVFAAQVAALTKAGVSRIETYAAGRKGSPTYNGYYTWPRFGYDAHFGGANFDAFPPDVKERTEKILGSDQSKWTLRGLFDRVPGGRDAWKNHGGGGPMQFDLSDGSPSQKALAAYIEERRRGRA